MSSISNETPAVSPPTPAHKCIVCGEHTSRRCGQCREAKYCSSICQETDWTVHKLLCKEFKNFLARPKTNMRRGVVFDKDNYKPRFFWIEIQVNNDGEDVCKHMKEILGKNFGNHNIIGNPVRNRWCSDGNINMYFTPQDFGPYRYKFNSIGENKGIKNVTCSGTRWRGNDMFHVTGAYYCMYGDIVFLPSDQSLKVFRDINFQDLRDIADHLSTLYVDPNYSVTDVNQLNHENCMPGRCTAFAASLMDRSSWPIANPDPTTWPERARKLKGVRVQACGEQNFTLTEVLYPKDHPYLQDCSGHYMKSDRKLRIGIDVTSGVDINLAWLRGQIDRDLQKDPFAPELREDIRDIRDCLIPELIVEHKLAEKRDGPSKQLDFTFFRVDMADLSVEHMQALIDFSRENLLPLLENCFTKDDVITIATEKAFKKYFEKCRKKYKWGTDVLCPYDDALRISGKAYFGNPEKMCSCRQGKFPCYHTVSDCVNIGCPMYHHAAEHI